MVKNVVDILNEHYDRDGQYVEFPSCFNQIKGEDANFELVASNNLQKLRLARRANVVIKSIAIIFVHTEARGLSYAESDKRAECFRKIYECLQFDEIKVLTDLSKEEMIVIFDSLKQEADEFEKMNKDPQAVFTIAIANVGYSLNVKGTETHKLIAEKINLESPPVGSDGSEF